MGPVIDCFCFFNELDLLEIRINSLAPYVDHFILVESVETHSGKPKPLFFADNKDRFQGFPITHLVSPRCSALKKGDAAGNAWRREHFQREYLRGAIEHFDDDCVILLSDLDEIPDLEHWEGRCGVFRMETYYYCLNLKAVGLYMNCTVAEEKKNITTMNRLIHKRGTFARSGKGWQFSTLGNADQIRYKIESFAHTELQTPEFLDSLKYRRANMADPFAAGAPNWRQGEVELVKELPDGPKWLLQNLDKYQHLLC